MRPDAPRAAVTFDSCGGVDGPFYHGTMRELDPGALLVPGRGSN